MLHFKTFDLVICYAESVFLYLYQSWQSLMNYHDIQFFDSAGKSISTQRFSIGLNMAIRTLSKYFKSSFSGVMAFKGVSLLATSLLLWPCLWDLSCSKSSFVDFSFLLSLLNQFRRFFFCVFDFLILCGDKSVEWILSSSTDERVDDVPGEENPTCFFLGDPWEEVVQPEDLSLDAKSSRW